MTDVARLLNRMVADGVVSGYAVFGAVAQMRYTEAVVTMDADILIAVRDDRGIDVLRPAERGFRAEGEAVRVGAWPA